MVDASVAVLGLLRDGDARRRLAMEEIAVPHLIDPGVAHALRGQVLRGTITSDQGLRALQHWARLGVLRYPLVGLLHRVWALRHNLSAYDAVYVALAESLDSELVTADARLSTATGVECPITVLRR